MPSRCWPSGSSPPCCSTPFFGFRASCRSIRPMPPECHRSLSFNTAVSFVTGTNWQVYSGETQASYLAQMAGLVVAQFTAAAIGLSVALAVIRGIAGKDRTIGNFWATNPRPRTRLRPLVGPWCDRDGQPGRSRELRRLSHRPDPRRRHPEHPRWPVASMEAIKLFGTNGGSFYGAGGAHPFENPTGFTNMFDLLLVIVLPFAIALTFGRLLDRRRQGYAIVTVMAPCSLPTPSYRCRPKHMGMACCRRA